MSFVSIRDVRFSYAQEGEQPVVNAVDGVSLDIEKGEFIAVIGHNGCGKSTLLKLISGILYPDGGLTAIG